MRRTRVQVVATVLLMCCYHDREAAYRGCAVRGYRVRVVQCAVVFDTRARPTQLKRAADMTTDKGYAVAVAVDRPTMPAAWTPALEAARAGSCAGIALFF